MARAVMEGVTYSFKSVSELIFAMGEGIRPAKVIASGGGAASALWRQILADVFDLPVYTLSGSSEGGAYGAALVAGVGAGVWNSLDDAITVLKEESVTLPIQENAEVYKKHYEVYKSLYGILKPAFTSISML